MTAAEERRLALEEKKVTNDEHQRLVEEERKLFYIDTSNMDERQKEYINLARDEVLAKINVGKLLEGPKWRHECTDEWLWRHECHGRDEWTLGQLWIHGWLWRLWRHGSTTGCLLEEA
jgi:hypothetical protein